MKELNLQNINKSDIYYKISKFPDGQFGILLNSEILETDEIMIIISLRSSDDFIILLETVELLRFKNVKDISLNITYLLGARSDRRFDLNASFDLKVYSKLINSCNFKKVYICDVHSDVSLGIIENSISYMPNLYELYDYYFDKNIVLIFPDSGAEKRYSSLIKNFNVQKLDGILTGNKERNLATGEIKRYFLNKNSAFYNANKIQDRVFLIIDDICDGGATFNKVAEELKNFEYYDESNKIHLYTTHGIYSKGLENMPLISKFWTTDSYCKIESEKLKIINL